MDQVDWKPKKHVTGVLICVPAYGQMMTAHTAQSLYNLCQFLTFKKIPNTMCWLSAADIAEVRNIVLTKWYDGHPEFSHMLFVDADMEFPVGLVRDMLDFEGHVTGCIYSRRQMPNTAVGRMLKKDDKTTDIHKGFLKVAGVGAGVLLISRFAVQTMLKTMPEIIDTEITGHPGNETLNASDSKRLIRAFDPFFDDRGVKLSEDLAFCERWRKCGGDVWANVVYPIGHIGTFNYCIRYADSMLKWEAEDRSAAEKAEAA